MTKWNVNRGKQRENLPEAATDSAPKPGDYSLGSLKSRAAARAMAEAQKEGEDVIIHQIVYVSPDGTRENGDRIIIPARPLRR